MANTHALVIDDSRAMRLILSDLLQQLGYEISAVSYTHLTLPTKA